MASKKNNSLDKMMAECTKPHSLVHVLTGVGLGMIFVGLFQGLYEMAIVVGLLVLAMGIFADYAVQSKM